MFATINLEDLIPLFEKSTARCPIRLEVCPSVDDLTKFCKANGVNAKAFIKWIEQD